MRRSKCETSQQTHGDAKEEENKAILMLIGTKWRGRLFKRVVETHESEIYETGNGSENEHTETIIEK